MLKRMGMSNREKLYLFWQNYSIEIGHIRHLRYFCFNEKCYIFRQKRLKWDGVCVKTDWTYIFSIQKPGGDAILLFIFLNAALRGEKPLQYCLFGSLCNILSWLMAGSTENKDNSPQLELVLGLSRFSLLIFIIEYTNISDKVWHFT